MQRKAFLLVLTLAAGCGGDDDAATLDGAIPDASAPLCSGAFGDPAPVGGLSTDDWEYGARLSPDELTVYLSRKVLPSDDLDLFVAHRATVSASFGTPELLANVNSDLEELSPAVSADGRLLVFTRTDGTNPEELWMATRASPTDDFGPPVRADALDVEPNAHQAYLTEDGSQVWFTTDLGIYAANRNGDSWDTPVQLGPPLDGPPPIYPTLTSDGLSLYYGDHDGISLLRAQRTSVSEAFPPGEDIPIHFVIFIQPTWISDDGCRLYLNSQGTSSDDIFMATRAP